ncbi:hypothetical protein CC2G_015311 [Coprinopsis cinerea AmutBmut pab1-1]|nr:hypothetical protein CC2G_015311 [Coprinopsis cinerea AmutBmut pab1-1]
MFWSLLILALWVLIPARAAEVRTIALPSTATIEDWPPTSTVQTSHPDWDDAECGGIDRSDAHTTTHGGLGGVFGRRTWNWCPAGVDSCTHGHCCSDEHRICCRMSCCYHPKRSCRTFKHPPPDACCIPGQSCGPLLESAVLNGGDTEGTRHEGLSMSDKIALGVGIGIGLPGAIVAIASMAKWCSPG